MVDDINRPRNPRLPIADEADPFYAHPRGKKGEEPTPHGERPLDGLPQANRGASLFFNFPLDTSTMGPQAIVRARSQSEEAEMFCITLGLIDSPTDLPTTSGIFTSHKALIEWGVGGASYSATVDWMRGGKLFVCANTCQVSVIVDSNPLSSVYSTTFNASIAYGNPGERRNRAKLTMLLPTLGNGASSALVRVPDFAKSFTIEGVDATPAGPVTITQFINTVPGNKCGVHHYVDNTNLTDQSAEMFPLGAGARTIQLKNDTGVPISTPRVVFSIDL